MKEENRRMFMFSESGLLGNFGFNRSLWPDPNAFLRMNFGKFRV